MHQFHSSPPPRRSGVILLIVVIMLALFLVVGLSFMLYAESEASASRIYREAFTVNYDRADIEPGTLLNWAMGQLVYDVSDYGDGVYSGLRGHSLARNMYGWNFQTGPGLTYVNTTNNNLTPFNGYGRLDSSLDPPPPGMPATTDSRQLINYTFFANPQSPAGAFIRDPERVGVRTGTGNPLDWPTTALVSAPFAGGINVPYTFPDRNNVFLAALKANDTAAAAPTVMLPSLHRPQGTPFDTTLANIQSTDPNVNPWLNTSDPSLKYKVLRPRPAEMYFDPNNPSRSFPLPGSLTGDVQNLPGGNGLDSFWMDLGYPVNVTRGGMKYKPLFAFLVVDLDNRVNLNVHGNIRGQNNTHVSNQGWGPWEVNPTRVLNDPINPNEVLNLFIGNGTAPGRYGVNQVPGGVDPTLPPPLPNYHQQYPLYPYLTTGGTMRAPYQIPVDIDSVDENGAPTVRLRLPSEVPNPKYRTVPDFNSPSGYDSMVYTTPPTASIYPPKVNPGLYNVLSTGRIDPVTGRANDDTPLDLAANLYYLIGQASGPNHTRSQVYQLGLTNNLAQPKIRHMLTTLSYDLDAAGARPWVTNPAAGPGSSYVLHEPQPTDPVANFVPNGQKGFEIQAGQNPATVNPTGNIPGSDFTTDGRCAVLPRLDLNRKLTPYPFDVNHFNVNVIGPPPPAIGPNAVGLGIVPQPLPGNSTLYRAIWERQQYAKEILERLVKATGAAPLPDPYSVPPVVTPQPPPEQYNALRYLAQLAVNIVDHFDDDEYMTPFYWNLWTPTDVVFGVESTKVVLNEVYGEVRNKPGQDTGTSQDAYRTHFWIELFNTHMNATLANPALNLDVDSAFIPNMNRGWARLETNVSLFGNPTPQAQAAYRVRVFRENPGQSNMRALANVTGDPMFPGPPAGNLEPTPRCQVTRYSNGTPGVPGPPPTELRVIEGNDGNSQGVNGDNKRGMYVIASEDIFEMPAAPDPNNVLPTNKIPASGTEGLSYDVPATDTIEKPNHTVVLQRLLCPHLPANENPADPTMPYNPYVTVDYVQGIQIQDAVKLKLPVIPGVENPNPAQLPYAERRSFGRAQPMTAGMAQNPASKFTFFAPNFPNNVQSFDWVVHPDRPPVSVMDLLHVSGFKPHEVTQTFLPKQPQFSGAPGLLENFGHVAPWTSNTSRLYRALEYFTAGNRGYWTRAGVATTEPEYLPSSGGRVPGKINVNTVWDKEVLLALTDPKPINQPSPNFFNETHVDTAWSQLLGRRTQQLGGSLPAPNLGRPFGGFANPGVLVSGPPPPNEFPTVSGYEGTMLANGSAGASFVFNGNTAPLHPAVAQEMLAKMANNTTTRSNTFAVYLTVGFFEVMDDTVRPVRLGAEIRTRNGTPIRHKFFAVVDRTNLAVEDPNFTAMTGGTAGLAQAGRFTPTTPPGPERPPQMFLTCEEAITSEMLGQPQILKIVGGLSYSKTQLKYEGKEIDLTALINPTTGRFRLNADFGVRRETIECQVDTATGKLIVPAGFTKTHAAGFTLSLYLPGNPGPQGSIDLKNDPRYDSVIPYWVIIQ